MKRSRKITLGEMRASGVRGLLICCSDYRCSHSITVNADQWPDETRLSDLEKQFTCSVCGRKGAEVRPDFDWDKEPVRQTGFRAVVVTDKVQDCPGFGGPTHDDCGNARRA